MKPKQPSSKARALRHYSLLPPPDHQSRSGPEERTKDSALGRVEYQGLGKDCKNCARRVMSQKPEEKSVSRRAWPTAHGGQLRKEWGTHECGNQVQQQQLLWAGGGCEGGSERTERGRLCVESCLKGREKVVGTQQSQPGKEQRSGLEPTRHFTLRPPPLC